MNNIRAKFQILLLVAFFPEYSIAQYDKLGIEFASEMQHDSSALFLQKPSNPQDNNFKMALSIPAVDFAIQQGLDPWNVDDLNGIWGGWGEVTRGPDNCFYYSIGNHMDYNGGGAYIFKYDPVLRIQSTELSSREVAGWTDTDFADGKLHGKPDIAPNGDMWLLSFFGNRPSSAVISSGEYKGGILIYHNVLNGVTENLGQPVYGQSWPYHSWDWQGDILFAVNEDCNFVMSYNTKDRSLIYNGTPGTEVDGYYWYKRCVLLDRSTGKFFSNDAGCDVSGNPVYGTTRFISYDPKSNEFELMNSRPPAYSDGKYYPTRAHTLEKDKNGAFWCMDSKGTIFKFYPEKDSTAFVDYNWGGGKYMGAMRFSPDKRYIYYVCDALTQGDRYGTPVVQYDTETNTKKVLAFIRNYYVNKYGYNPGGTYGVELDSTGSFLFFYINGKFTSGNSGYGRPSLFCLNIPESERSGSNTTIDYYFNQPAQPFNIYPNPFTTRATIEFMTSKVGKADIIIYNSMGEMIRTISFPKLTEGKHYAYWDGTDNAGSALPNGVYFISLIIDHAKQTKKLVLLR